LHRMRLLRLYENDEQANARMPKETRLVTAFGKWVESKCQKLGGTLKSRLSYSKGGSAYLQLLLS
jgi:hypothetical protein